MYLMNNDIIPTSIGNWIKGAEIPARDGVTFSKISPHDASPLTLVARSQDEDVNDAVAAAREGFPTWGDMPAVKRGDILHAICNQLEQQNDRMARVVAAETGKSYKEALGEVGGAIALGRFFAGEGQRLYGRTTTSGTENKYAMTVRQPCGVAGLIIAANTPIANVAWKVFPALICGNGVVLKSAEDTPITAWLFSKIAHEVDLPAGVLNVVQGLGAEAGEALIQHHGVDVLSFTGSTRVGRHIAQIAGQRLTKVSLELGGKNPLIVCEDADLDNAVKWVCLSSFSNAGQRCASGSRIIVMDAVYDEFRLKLIDTVRGLKMGPTDDDDFGPVINERQINNMLSGIEEAISKGASILAGGKRSDDPNLAKGFYMEPTVIEGVGLHDPISETELFGPIACLYRARDYNDAIELANNSPYGLTAAIHTRNYDRAMQFAYKIRSGVAVVNAGTYGSEPHMPFGGLRASGNGSREPGTEALDVYSELKDIYLIVDPSNF